MADDPDEGMLSWDESVFQDERVFEIDYVPETFRHRTTQMETLKYALKPAVRGSRPLNVTVHGPPGTGKTTAVQILFRELQASTDVRVVRVNCQVNSTRYAVFSRLFEGVFDYEPPSSGVSFKKLFSQVTDQLVDNDEVLVVALDDIYYLFYESEASDTLYSLLRAHEEQGGARIGVIVVSSDLELDIIETLDGRVQSVFRPEDVYFSAYDEAAIAEILADRAARGFHDDVVDAPVLDRVAELTADQGGDLRVGIDLLRRAGLTAEMRGSTTVEHDDVETAYETSKHVHLSRRLQGLSDSERALVAVVADHDGEQAGAVYEAFHDQTSLGYTRYSEIVNKLSQLDILEASYADVDGRGRTRELSLNYEPAAVTDRL
jgi:orc1/cdc6 family replication initiation protein